MYNLGLEKAVLCLVTQSCLTLCDPMVCSPPGFSVHEILQATILEWVAMPSSRGSSQPRDGTYSSVSPALAGGCFTTSATWEARACKDFFFFRALYSIGLHIALRPLPHF